MVQIRVPHVCERDVDLLLLEEFCSSSEFCIWFQHEIGLATPGQLSEARHSEVSLEGETDVDLVFDSSRGQVRVLIENKVDAMFQPLQPERYAQRKQRYGSVGTFSEVVTVLIAPQGYFGTNTEIIGFDRLLSYEKVAKWFAQAGYPDGRLQYKLAILNRAIERGRIGYVHVPNEEVSAFRHQYWRIVQQLSPDLGMNEPDKTARNYIIDFHPVALAALDGLRLRHKVERGFVDLEILRPGDALLAGFNAEREGVPDLQVARVGRSTAFRLRVSPVDMSRVEAGGAFHEFEDSVREGVLAAKRMLDWFLAKRRDQKPKP